MILGLWKILSVSIMDNHSQEIESVFHQIQSTIQQLKLNLDEEFKKLNGDSVKLRLI
jgi:hypothetical protein